MSRKIVFAVWALALLLVTAWADTSVGGEGGCINLPGGRTSGGSRPNSVSGEPPAVWQASTTVGPQGVLLRMPDELFGAVGVLRANSLPITAVYGSVDGYLRLPANLLGALRLSGVGFSLELRNLAGETLMVDASLSGSAEVVFRLR